MQELFLSFLIEDHARNTAIKILTGFCDMSPVPILRRKLVWHAPPEGKRGIDPAFLNKQTGPVRAEWEAISAELQRQRFGVTLLYDIRKEQFPQIDENGALIPSQSTSNSLDDEPGALVWADIPIPGENQVVNNRNLSRIENQKDLCNILRASKYIYQGEMVEEGSLFVTGNVVITVTRVLPLPRSESNGSAQDGVSQINVTLPPYETLRPVDGANKWIMTAKVDVGETALIKQGKAELLKVQSAFDECFNLKALDRFYFDTRVKGKA